MDILRIEHLTKTYGTGDTAVRALDDVSFSVAAGEFVAIIGSSGSGKSTVLHMFGGVDRPTSGTVYLNGENVFERSDEQLAVFRRREVGLVYQFYNLVPVLDVVENMCLPVLMDGRAVNEKRLNNMLRTLGLVGREHHLPNQLSGGQQQRVAIGRALMNAPAVVLADEPTGNLDSKNSAEIMALLQVQPRAQADAHRDHPRRGHRTHGRSRHLPRGRPHRLRHEGEVAMASKHLGDSNGDRPLLNHWTHDSKGVCPHLNHSVFVRYTLRSLAANRVRTVVTVVGVALATGLLAAVLVSVTSLRAALIAQSCASGGVWQAGFTYEDAEKIDELRAATGEHLDRLALRRDLGAAALSAESAEESGTYLGVLSLPEEQAGTARSAGDDQYAVIPKPTVAEGRLPERTGEIALPAYLQGAELTAGRHLRNRGRSRL